MHKAFQPTFCSSWTMETLPAPNDARVSLKPVPARRFVAITFSGIATDAAIAKRTDELRAFARRQPVLLAQGTKLAGTLQEPTMFRAAAALERSLA